MGILMDSRPILMATCNICSKASPPEDPKTVSQEATPPGNSVPGQWTMMTPLPAWEPPSASLPAKRKQGRKLAKRNERSVAV